MWWKKGKSDALISNIDAEIHNAVFSAQDSLINSMEERIAEANMVLNKGSDKDEVLDMLMRIGFTSQKDVKKFVDDKKKEEVAKEESEKSSKLLKHINRLSLHYGKKFIDHRSVVDVCSRFGLMCAPISMYNAEIPEENMREIADFKIYVYDVAPVIEIRYRKDIMDDRKALSINGYPMPLIKGGSVLDKQFIKDEKDTIISYIGEDKYNEVIGSKLVDVYVTTQEADGTAKGIAQFNSVEVGYCNLKGGMMIAPPHKFDVPQKKKGFFFKPDEVEIKDPVVLQPVRGGYLIVSAWGFESTLIEISQSKNVKPSMN